MKDNFGRVLTLDEELTVQSMGRAILPPPVAQREIVNKEMVHGESPGHPFRGNQFGDGEAGVASSGTRDKTSVALEYHGKIKGAAVSMAVSLSMAGDKLKGNKDPAHIELKDAVRNLESQARGIHQGMGGFNSGTEFDPTKAGDLESKLDNFRANAYRVSNDAMALKNEGSPVAGYVESKVDAARAEAFVASKLAMSFKNQGEPKSTELKYKPLDTTGFHLIDLSPKQHLEQQGFSPDQAENIIASVEHLHGESPGHPFRGNQFGEGQSAGSGNESNKVSGSGLHPDYGRPVSEKGSGLGGHRGVKDMSLEELKQAKANGMSMLRSKTMTAKDAIPLNEMIIEMHNEIQKRENNELDDLATLIDRGTGPMTVIPPKHPR